MYQIGNINGVASSGNDSDAFRKIMQESIQEKLKPLHDRVAEISSSVATGFNMQAAMQVPGVRAVFHLMAARGVETPTSRVSIAELDRRLKGSGLTTQQCIEIKLTLDRVGMISC